MTPQTKGNMDEEQIETPVTEPVATLKPNQKMLQVGDRSITIDRTTKRQVSFDRAMIDDATRTITIPISSEYVVERWWGDEILSHADGAVDLSRLNDGGGFLFNHDPRRYLGVSQKAFLQNRRVYAELRFDTHPEAEQIYQSVKSGILRNVSIGYSIDEAVETTVTDGDPDNYNSASETSITATKWCPFEVSIVTVPADPTVGIGRSLTNDAEPPPVQPSTPIESPIQEEQIRMETTEKIDIEAVLQQERDRNDCIRALCHQHKMPDSMRDELIKNGSSIDLARALVLERIGQTPQQPIAQPVPALGLTDKEEREYSLLRAIEASSSHNWSNAGFELEISQEIARQRGQDTSGFYVPIRDLKIKMKRATYASSAPNTGGALVQTVLDSTNFIEFLRNQSLVVRMGAEFLSGLNGNLDIPKETGKPTVYWVTAEGSTIGQSESTFGIVQFRPRTLGHISRVTDTMKKQGSLDIEQLIRRNMAIDMANEIDRASLAGSGASGEPVGLLNNSSVPTVALGTNGAAPTWASLVRMETLVSKANKAGTMGYLTNPDVRGKLKTTIKNPAGTDSTWIWETPSMADSVMGTVNGYMAGCTNQVPSDLTKGTGTALSAILFGAWSNLYIGEWGTLEIMSDPYTLFSSGGIQVRALQTVDIQPTRTDAFAKIVDAITT